MILKIKVMLPFVVRLSMGSIVISGYSSENWSIELKWQGSALALLLRWWVFLRCSIVVFVEFSLARHVGWISFIIFLDWHLFDFLWWGSTGHVLILFVIAHRLEVNEWSPAIFSRKNITFTGLVAGIDVDWSCSLIPLTSWSSSVSSMSSYSESFPSVASVISTRSAGGD